MAALLLLPLLLPLLLLPPLLHLWPRWRWLAADLAFAVRAYRCKRALQARALAAAAADPQSPEAGCSLAWRLAQLARQRPAHTFLVHGAQRFSYAEAERLSNRAARVFLRARGWDGVPGGGSGTGGSREGERAAGSGVAGAAWEGDGAAPLAPGATVALLLPARPEFLWLWFGMAKAGLRTAFVPTALRRGPLLHCLRSCGARALVLAPGKAGAAARGGAHREGARRGSERRAQNSPWGSPRVGRRVRVCEGMQLDLWCPECSLGARSQARDGTSILSPSPKSSAALGVQIS